jgi:undecaprenyl-diphosphatase
MFESVILFSEWFANTYGLLGVFIISLLESFIFPVPTSVIIAPVTAFGIDPFFITVVATTGSIIGAVIGYFLGVRLGRPVAERLFKKHVPRVERWFDRWGAWAVLIAAFSPVPFKVFTWCAGIFKLDMKRFLIASIIGRTAQFAIAAYVGAWFGPGVISWLTGF